MSSANSSSSSYRTKFSSEWESVLPSRGLEAHRAHELVNKLSAIQAAQKVHINIMGEYELSGHIQRLISLTLFRVGVKNKCPFKKAKSLTPN